MDSLHLNALRRIMPLNPLGGADMPNTADIFGRLFDFRISTDVFVTLVLPLHLLQNYRALDKQESFARQSGGKGIHVVL